MTNQGGNSDISRALDKKAGDLKGSIREGDIPETAQQSQLIGQGVEFLDQWVLDKAIEIFNRVLATDRTNESALAGKIAALRKMQRFKDAEALVQESLDLHPNSTAILNERGWIYIDQENFEGSLETFSKVLEAKNDDEIALQGKIASLRGLKKYDDAEDLVDKGLKLHPNSILILNERAWIYFNRDNYNDALNCFNKVLGISEDDQTAFQGKIASLRKNQKYIESEELIARALDKHPNNPAIAGERAWIYLEKNEIESAEKYFADLVHKYPYNIKLKLSYVEVLFILNRTNELLEIMKELKSSNPDNFEVRMGMIVALRKMQKFKDAEALVQESLDLNPNNTDILKERGRIYLDQENFDGSLETYNEVLKAKNDDEIALQGKIASLRGLKKYDEAENLADKGLKRHPNSTLILNERAWIYFNRKKYNDALRCFNKVLEIREDDQTAIQGKIASLRKNQNYTESEELIAKALDKYPNNPAIAGERAWICFEKNDLEKAEEYFADLVHEYSYNIKLKLSYVEVLIWRNRTDDALEIMEELKSSNPDNLEVREKLGRVYLRRRDLPKAKEEFEFIKKRVPQNIFNFNNIGLIYFNQGRYREAEDCFRRVLAARSNDPLVSVNLARTLIRQIDEGILNKESMKEAEGLCKEALKVDSHQAQAFGCLGVIEFKRGNLGQSEHYLKKSISISPREGSYTDLGALYMQMGEPEESEKCLMKALNADSQDSQAYAVLGSLHLQSNGTQDAIRSFRKAIRADTNNEYAHRALAVGLMQAGDLGDAEKVLRKALQSLDEPKRWRLHLTYSQLLTRLGDANHDDLFYKDALKEINIAKKINSKHPDPYFYSGIVNYKCKNYFYAWLDMRSCKEIDKDYLEADRNERLIQSLLVDEYVKSSYPGSILAGVASAGLLYVIWTNYISYGESKIPVNILMILTPILLGLIIISSLLPSLIKLKLPGIEAELSRTNINQPEESMQFGPSAGIGFSGFTSSIDAGLR